MIRRPPRSTLFPYTRSSDLLLTLWRRRLDDGSRAPLECEATPHRDLLNVCTLTHHYALGRRVAQDRKSTRLNSSHANISYAVFCLKKKKTPNPHVVLMSK